MAHENSSEEIATALNSILNRLKSTRTNKVINALIQTNAVTKLVAYLDKFGSNVSSVSVGILEALLQFEQPRNQISKCNGIEKIVQLLDNTSEESTIYHICKTITNMESDSKLLTTCWDKNLVTILLKKLSTSSSNKNKQIILIYLKKMATEGKRFKERIIFDEGFSYLINILHTTDSKVLKEATMCLSILTNGTTQFHSESGFKRLLQLATFEDKRISDNSLCCLTNLSYSSSNLRSKFGNPALVSILVKKYRETMSKNGMKVLCLLCRESINRMILREMGVLGMFVNVLKDKHFASVVDCVLYAILEMQYDKLSLEILQERGIIMALIDLLMNEIELIEHYNCSVIPSIYNRKSIEFLNLVKSDKHSKDKVCKDRVKVILHILLQLCYNRRPHMDLYKLRTIKVLVCFCYSTSDSVKSMANKILSWLSRHTSCAINFVPTGAIPWLWTTFDKNTPCELCNAKYSFTNAFTTNVSNSILNIYTNLITSLSDWNNKLMEKRAIACSIPFIFENQDIIKKFLINYKCLDLIVQAFETPDDDFFPIYIQSIHHLSKNVLFNNQDTLKKLKKSIHSHINLCKSKVIKNEVKFVFSDGSEVFVDRTFLIDRNEIFRAMLNCNFAEAGSTVILIPNMSKLVFESLVHYLYGCDCFIRNMNMEELTELLFVSDMYLINEFKTIISTEMVCRFADNNFVDVYVCAKFVQKFSVNELFDSFMIWTLIGSMTFTHRCNLFRQLLKQNNFVEDLNQFLKMKIASIKYKFS